MQQHNASHTCNRLTATCVRGCSLPRPTAQARHHRAFCRVPRSAEGKQSVCQHAPEGSAPRHSRVPLLPCPLPRPHTPSPFPLPFPYVAPLPHAAPGRVRTRTPSAFRPKLSPVSTCGVACWAVASGPFHCYPTALSVHTLLHRRYAVSGVSPPAVYCSRSRHHDG